MSLYLLTASGWETQSSRVFPGYGAIFHFPTQVQARHCTVRGRAGADFASAVKMKMLVPLHFGLSQETDYSWVPLDHCPLWQRQVCGMCARLLLAAGLFFTMEQNAYPESTVSGLLSAESLLWSKCLCFQTPFRPVYSFSTWLQDKSVLAVSKGVNAFSKILCEAMRIGGTPNPNILLIYAVRAAGKLDILQRNWLFPPSPLLFFFPWSLQQWNEWIISWGSCCVTSNTLFFELIKISASRRKKWQDAQCSRGSGGSRDFMFVFLACARYVHLFSFSFCRHHLPLVLLKK